MHSSIGFKPSKLPTLMPLFLTLGCCLFYSAFLGDIFTPLLSLLLPSLSLSRTAVLVTLAIVPLAPLCLLDDLSSLQVSSFAGLGGIFYTICFIGYRAITGGYRPGGGEPKILRTHKYFHPLSFIAPTLTLTLAHSCTLTTTNPGRIPLSNARPWTVGLSSPLR